MATHRIAVDGSIRDTGRTVACHRQITDRTGGRDAGAERNTIGGRVIGTTGLPASHHIAVNRTVGETCHIPTGYRQITDRTGRRHTGAERNAIGGRNRHTGFATHRIAVDRPDVFGLFSFAFDAGIDQQLRRRNRHAQRNGVEGFGGRNRPRRATRIIHCTCRETRKPRHHTTDLYGYVCSRIRRCQCKPRKERLRALHQDIRIHLIDTPCRPARQCRLHINGIQCGQCFSGDERHRVSVRDYGIGGGDTAGGDDDVDGGVTNEHGGGVHIDVRSGVERRCRDRICSDVPDGWAYNEG